jgi:hypothetical protein
MELSWMKFVALAEFKVEGSGRERELLRLESDCSSSPMFFALSACRIPDGLKARHSFPELCRTAIALLLRNSLLIALESH